MIQRFFLVLWALWVCCSPSPSSSPGRSSGPRLPPPPAVCPHAPILLQRSNSGRWSPIQPFWCQHPGESHGAAWYEFGTVMNYCPGSGQNREADDTLIRVPHRPTYPWVFPLAYKSPVPCSFVIKSVQQKADHFTQSHECVNSHLPLICIFKAFYLFLWVQLLFTSWRHFRLHLADGSSSEGNWVRGGRRASWFGRDPSLLLDIFWSLDSQAASNTTGKAGPGLSCLLNTGGRDKR